MESLKKHINHLKSVFAKTSDKHEANYLSHNIMQEMSADENFLTEALKQHIQTKDSLNTKNYPTVGLNIELNPHFVLVANCWIPLPDKATDVSTKAIHHHGDMLLTTATAFGPGYEHWTFNTPAVVDAAAEIYSLKPLEFAPHPLHHVAFVDAYVAHLPLYPPSLTITYALWSNRFPVTWKDYVKRLPIFQKNNKRLRAFAAKAGLKKQLDLKVVEYYDFFPSDGGFCGIRDRREFERGPNEDYLASLFHILQKTGNENLSPLVRQKLESGEYVENRTLVEKYLADLEKGIEIEGKLSADHYNVPYANFTKEKIVSAIEFQEGKTFRIEDLN